MAHQGSKIPHAAWNGKKKKKSWALMPGFHTYSREPLVLMEAFKGIFFNFGEEEVFLNIGFCENIISESYFLLPLILR